MTDLIVRQYEPRDADAVWNLHERALREAGAFDPDLAHLDADLRRIEDVYLDPGGEFLVGEVDSEIVAMGAFRPLGASDHDATLPLDHAAVVERPASGAVLKRMRVDPDHYREGFGTVILDELEDSARAQGIETLVLDTTPTQDTAVAFYEDSGYERARRDETDHGPVLFYRKQL